MTGPEPQDPDPTEPVPADGSRDTESSAAEQPGAATGSTARPPGGVRFQDPESTRRREPTLAEQRERERVRRDNEEQARLQAEMDAADLSKRRKRRNALIGGGVAVGLVGIVAATYLVASSDNDEYEAAQCVDQNNVVVEDRYCGDNSNGFHSGGLFFFAGLGGSRYQYYYGGNTPVGQPASGGSPNPAPNKSYANSSGKAVTSDGKTGGAVSRGGFGSKSGSSTSGGSKSGGSSSGGKSSGS